MSSIIFNEFQMRQLELNPNVLHVSERSITYHPDYKVKAVKEYSNGKSASQIFIEHGFDLNIIGAKKPKQCLQRWRKTVQQFGEAALATERRGKASEGRPVSKKLSLEEQLRKAEARIAFLEVENQFLKKLDELERQALKKKR
jgi:transposase